MVVRILIPLLLFTFFLSGRDISGIYMNSKLGEVSIRAFGKENKGYFLHVKENQYFFTPEGKTYVHYNKKSEERAEKWVIYPNKKHLRLTRNKNSYLLKRKAKLLEPSAPKPKTFQQFNLNSTNYCAGEFYDLSPKAFLPFMFDRKFIVAHSQKNLSIMWYEGNHTNKDQVARYQFFYEFDSYGNTKAMKANTYFNGELSKNKIEWQYFYRNEVKGVLDSVVMHTKIFTGGKLRDNVSVLTIDADNWAIDKYGQKWPRANLFNWSYDEKGKPIKWKGKQGKREDFSMDFIYEKDLLTQMIFRNEKTEGAKVSEFNFEYSTEGFLKSVTRIE